MINAHPQVAIPPEAKFVERLIAVEPQFRQGDGSLNVEALTADLLADPHFLEWDLPAEHVRREIAALRDPDLAAVLAAAYRAYAALRGKPRWGDKTPRHVRYLPVLARMWPDARFVHLIRDGRDVATSLNSAPFGPKTTVAQARYWANRVRDGVRDGGRLGPDRYLEVRYESLVREPASELLRICELIDLPFDAAMIAHHELSAGTIPRSEFAHQHGAMNRVRQGARDWRTEMTPSEISAFEAAEGRLLDELGYQRGGKRAPVAWMEARFGDIRESVDLRRRLRRRLGLWGSAQ